MQFQRRFHTASTLSGPSNLLKAGVCGHRRLSGYS